MCYRLMSVLILSCIISCFSLISQGQPVFARINQSLNTFYQKYPQEKVYLQNDKHEYEPGDRIWFKAYLTNQEAPTVLSSILYVEFIDFNGKILDRETLAVKNGTAACNLSIPDYFPAGNYRIRAYTSWMMNFGVKFYFDRDIPVVERGNNISLTNGIDSSGYSLQFFPEGGTMVQGLTSKIAFIASNDLGMGVDVKGKIVDSSGKMVA
jgi:hypothetical protein